MKKTFDPTAVIGSMTIKREQVEIRRRIRYVNCDYGQSQMNKTTKLNRIFRLPWEVTLR